MELPLCRRLVPQRRPTPLGLPSLAHGTFPPRASARPAHHRPMPGTSRRPCLACTAMWDQSRHRGASSSSMRDMRVGTSKVSGKAPKDKPSKWDEFTGRLFYNYYNWRQDTSSDLQLVLIGFMALILGNSLLRSLLVDSGPPKDALAFWADLYEVIILSFGQEFPSEGASIAHQMFSVGVAGLGLAGFALVLALVEQVVMEMIEANVRRGSKVYESGHVLLVGWCNSQRDLEVVWKSLEQLCYAHKPMGGTTVVVLTQREKLEMEALFRRAIPDHARFGTRFVFRQGNPLVVRDLDMVSAQSARTTMIISDQSRCPEEADAQSLRCAILLCELTSSSGTSPEQQRSRSGAEMSWLPHRKDAAARGTQLQPQQQQQQQQQRLDGSSIGDTESDDAGEGTDWDTPPQEGTPCYFECEIPGRSDKAARPSSGAKKNNNTAAPAGKRGAGGGTNNGHHGSNGSGGPAYTTEQPSSAALGSGYGSGSTDSDGDASSAEVSEWRTMQPLPLGSVTGDELGTYDEVPAGRRHAVERSNGTQGAPGNGLVAAASGTAHALGNVLHAAGSAMNGNGNGSSHAATSGKPATASAASQPQCVSDVLSRYEKFGHVAVELKTANAIPLLRYACSARFQAVPTALLNARRLAKMLREPIIATTSQQLFDYTKPTNLFVQAVPQMVGKRFAELMFWWDDAVVIGVYQCHRDRVKLNPPLSYKLLPTDQLVLFRPTTTTAEDHQPMARPINVACHTRWLAKKIAEQQRQQDQQQVQRSVQTEQAARDSRFQPSPANLKESIDSLPEEVQRYLSQSVSGSVSGSFTDGTDPLTGAAGLPRDGSPGASVDAWGAKARAPGAASGRLSPSPGGQAEAQQAGAIAGRAPAPVGAALDGAAMRSVGQLRAASMEASVTSQLGSISEGSVTGSFEAQQTSAMFMVPLEYLIFNNRPRRVMVCGWGEHSFMHTLLRELDSGGACLPPGSEVVFVNNHTTESTLGKALPCVRPRNIAVSHVLADPLQRGELAQARVDEFSAAIVLCDERWVDPDNDASNGVDPLCQADLLRLDAMVMMVQLNLRKLLEDQERPSMNIICQKVAMEGMTRFEDRSRLPLGVSVNLTSFAAKIMTQASNSPLFMPVFSKYGALRTSLTVMDASELADEGEKLNWWQLAARAQTMHKVLVGWYNLPVSINAPMEVVLNPQGAKLRSKIRVWNKGDGTLKFLVFGQKGEVVNMAACPIELDFADDDDVIDMSLQGLSGTEQPAKWVQMGVYRSEEKTAQKRELAVVGAASDSE